MAAAATGSSRSLEQTPTWAFAAVYFAFISISILLVHLIDFLSKWLKKHRKKALIDAVDKVKSELMLLGFISMLLAITQRPITYICVSNKVANTLLPCHKLANKTSSSGQVSTESGGTHRRLLSIIIDGANERQVWSENLHRRLLSDGPNIVISKRCAAKGMASLISREGVHQLHIFIFVLAVMHVAFSGLTMALGRAKMRRWKAWEKETQTPEYQIANDPRRFRYIRQTTFVRRHLNSWTNITIHLWIKCFFRQFYSSVAKVDYFTLRHGFISAHLSANTVFDFRKYIERSLEDDFKAVVGISPIMWFLIVIFMLSDVHGWHTYFWLSFLPLITVFAVGAKLQVIVARMALQLKEQSTVIEGVPRVQPSDELFWFGRPKLVLVLIHFILFQNSFELSFFIWIWYEFGLRSCYHEKFVINVARVVLAVAVQFICSYITLPLYALVTQMGSQFKRSGFEEQTVRALKQWHTDVRQNRKKQQRSNSRLPSGNNNTTLTQVSSSFSRRSSSNTVPFEITYDHEITEEKSSISPNEKVESSG